MLTLRQAFDDCMALLGYESADFAPVSARNRVFANIQSTLQKMQNSGEDYYTGEPLVLPLTSGTSAYLLEDDVAKVLSAITLNNGQPLRVLTSRGQFIQFGQLFMGQTDNSQSPGLPLAYWVDPQRNYNFTAGTAGTTNSVKIIIHFAPLPSTGISATFDVIKVPPLFQMSDLCNTTTPPVIPVPHNYTESIFMPILRWELLAHPQWYKQELVAGIQAGYKQALKLLGYADPRRPKPEESSADALQVGPQPQQGEPAQ